MSCRDAAARGAWLGSCRQLFAVFWMMAWMCGWAAGGEPPRPEALIGYTELQTDLPGGRHANVVTMRAVVVRANGTGRRVIGENLTRQPSSWTSFAGWSPDGQTAIVGRGWASPENAAWEEEHKQFRFAEGAWSYDMILIDLAHDRQFNATAVDRVSFYNSGVFFWPDNPRQLGFQALIDGKSHPFRMDRDGHDKRDLTKGSRAFTYGFSASPDGRRVAYHKDFQVYVADAQGANARQVKTGQAFNFFPQWSPDGAYLAFLSGQHLRCHPYLVDADGSGLRKLADRKSYAGVVDFLDVPDFHGGSSDVPVWAPDGQSLFYTGQVGRQVHLLRVTLDGKSEQLTRAEPDARYYHPAVSPDGKWLACGGKRDGVRQIYIIRLDDRHAYALTSLAKGRGAMWPHWQTRQ